MKTSRFRPILFLFLTVLIVVNLNASPDSIRLNQTGFYTYGPKIAIIVEPQTWYFSIRSTDLETVYYRGELSVQERWGQSRENVKRADFSSFTRKGTYVLYLAEIGASYPFIISDNPLKDVSRGLLRAFYYQRSSTSLPSSYADKWSRNAGHPDDYVLIHPSAASDPTAENPRKTDEAYSSPKGWYDAGDYGKYVVNAGISTYELLLLYEQFPDYCASLDLKIPESGDTIPDILNEIKWELDWLLTMQDPADSGVYHKLTTKYFTADISPANATAQRYFIGKGAAASFDFSAVCAVAYRIYKSFLPSFADSCLTAAKGAWKWGMQYPDSSFRNPSDVVTGQYGDRSLKDERQWASFELFIATGDSAYFYAADSLTVSSDIPEWPNTGSLGRYSMALHTGDSASIAAIITTADRQLATIFNYPYRIPMSSDFYWGSNGVAANQGGALLVAYLLTKNIDYLEGAIHASDYLLGRNATGYCFVTGFGHRSPMDPHHRPSISDHETDPVPGFLVGGPNSQSRGGESCMSSYPSPRAQAYLDHHCSFTTNEVAINWNAAGALLTNGINAIFSSSKYDLSSFKTRYESSDTSPPGAPVTVVDAVGTDHAFIRWQSSEPAVASLICSSDDISRPRREHSPRDTTGLFIVNGLSPSTMYRYTCYLVDDAGNIASVQDSFRTEPSTMLSDGETVQILPEPFTSNAPWQVSTSGISAETVRLVYSEGGSSETDTMLFTKTGSSFTAILPESHITDNGINYQIEYLNENDTLRSRCCGIAPDSLTVSKTDFATMRMYQMISIPGIYPPIPSFSFRSTLGDTSQWRFFGYDQNDRSYLLFNSIQSGEGGLIYHKESFDFTRTVGGIAPDSLFPIILKSGWNCISSPFLFDIFWDNTFIDCDGAHIAITDSVSRHFLNRQFFTWYDSTTNNSNDGIFLTNRDLTSHVFQDSACLSPWKSYWVFSERDDITCFLNPSQERSPVLVAKKRSDTRQSWFCSLHFSSGGHTDGPIVFGSAEGALDSYDLFDSPKPPSVSGFLKTGFIHSDWPTKATLFGSDITSYTNNEYTWTTRITSSKTTPVTLRWSFEGTRSGYCYLVDSLAGVTIAMNDTGSYLFSGNETATPRILTFTNSMTRLSSHGVADSWSFSTNGTQSYRFNFSIPSSGRALPVSLVIYDLLGHPVKTILKETCIPGFHSVYWNGTSDQMFPLANGLYIVRFLTPSYSKTTRLSIVNR